RGDQPPRAGTRLRAGSGRAALVRAGAGAAGPVRARLSPRVAGGAHDRRPRRRGRAARTRTSGRGAAIPQAVKQEWGKSRARREALSLTPHSLGSYAAAMRWNWASSVEPFSAVVDDCPCWIAWVTASK